MKRFLTLAALAAAMAFAPSARPDDASSWYAPQTWAEGESASADIHDKWSPADWRIELDPNGEATKNSDYYKMIDSYAYDSAAMLAIEAALAAVKAQVMVKNMAKVLEATVVTDIKEENGTVTYTKGLVADAKGQKTGNFDLPKYYVKDNGNFTYSLVKGGGASATWGRACYYKIQSLGGGKYALFEDDAQAEGSAVIDVGGGASVSVDGVSVATNASGQIRVYGFYDTEDNCGTTMSRMLQRADEDENRSKHFVMTRFGSGESAVVHWTPMGGQLDGGGADCDGLSVTTNSADGAVYAGKASLYGLKTAGGTALDPAFPAEADADSYALSWLALSSLCDGTSIARVSDSSGAASAAQLEVKGASQQSGNAKYFGLPPPNVEGSLGWWSLPNVTTNVVEADEKTIRSTTSADGQTKTLSLYSTPGSDGIWGASVDAAGALAWTRIAQGSAAGIFDPDEKTLTYLRSTVTNLAIKGAADNADKFLVSGGSGEGAENQWIGIRDAVTTTNGVAVSYGDTSAEIVLDGWDDPACAADLSKMLTGAQEVDRGRHRILARYDKDDGTPPKLHYIPISTVVNSGQAIKFVGTDASECVCGEGTTTNTVTFASDADSDVRVTVGGTPSAVTITFGVRYK